jgi:hypothetical protein
MIDGIASSAMGLAFQQPQLFQQARMVGQPHQSSGPQFSRSSAFSRPATSVGTRARAPLSTSALLTHSLSVCGVQPIVAAIEQIAAQRDGCSAS